MADMPQALQDILEDFSYIEDRLERQEYLIQLADDFAKVRVPESIATQPYAEENHVQQCESDAYVWAEEQADGTLKYYFDVLNPQGLSAMAMAVILVQSLSGASLDEVAQVNAVVLLMFFVMICSLGKVQGLMGIVAMAQHEAKKRLSQA